MTSFAEADLTVDESASVVLDAAGYGVARIGPGRAGVRWIIDSLSVLAAGAPTLTPKLYLYRGEPAAGKHFDSSYNGNQNSSDNLSIPLTSGQFIAAEWVGGDPGRRYSLSVYGKRNR